MFFSIIIPVRTINDFLKESISNLKLLDYKDYEVLIVTDHKESYKFPSDKFKLIESGEISPGEKRNLAAKQASGDILAFLDDDAWPTKDWLTNAKKVFEKNNCYALGAPAITPTNAKFPERMSGRVLESPIVSAQYVYRHLPKHKRYIEDYPTVNLFVAKDVFLKVGGFTKEFWPGEDTKLCLDLVKNKKKPFLYDPSPVVFHHRRNLFRPHLKQISRYGKHRGQFARILPETSRLPAYYIPSLFVLGLFFGWLSVFLSFYLFLFYTIVVGLYLVLVSFESLKVSFLEKSLKPAPYVFLGIILTHIVYGVSFIIGHIKRPALELRNVDKSSGNYIGG